MYRASTQVVLYSFCSITDVPTIYPPYRDINHSSRLIVKEDQIDCTLDIIIQFLEEASIYYER